jgi:hypothetical protein
MVLIVGSTDVFKNKSHLTLYGRSLFLLAENIWNVVLICLQYHKLKNLPHTAQQGARYNVSCSEILWKKMNIYHFFLTPERGQNNFCQVPQYPCVCFTVIIATQTTAGLLLKDLNMWGCRSALTEAAGIRGAVLWLCNKNTEYITGL